MKTNFRLIDPTMFVRRRPFAAASGLVASLNPNAASPLYDGEFLELSSDYQAIRGTGNSAKPSFAVLDLKGQTDVQTLGKVTLLFGGEYEAETRICVPSGCAVGDPLYVGDVTVDSQTKRGLVEFPGALGAGTYWLVGFVTKAPVDGYIRFLRQAAQRVVVS